MSKKNIIILISAIVFAAAAVTAIVVFRQQIAEFFESLKNKASRNSTFTPEEIEAFADI